MTAQILNMPMGKVHSDTKKQKTDKFFFPNLDGLRFIAFFAVFLYHSGHTEFIEILQDSTYRIIKNNIFSYGHLGVNFFFVLSGFLITYLLAHEYSLKKKIDLKSFYLRRTLRIWPLYIACLFLGFIAFPLLKSVLGQQPNETASVFLLCTFLGNFNNILHGLPDASILSVLWSVGIEEQFYLFWPILFVLFSGKRKIFMFFSVIIGSIIFRFFNYSNYQVIYFHTLSVISDMALGGLLGWLSFENRRFLKLIKDLPKTLIIFVYLTGTVLIILSKSFESQFAITFERLLLGIFFGFVILEQNFADNSFYKIGKSKFLTYWGKYTYGLYCLHFVGILITTNLFKLLKINNSLFHVLVVETAVSLLISMVISYVSFGYFEKYFLKLKNKFAY